MFLRLFPRVALPVAFVFAAALRAAGGGEALFASSRLAAHLPADAKTVVLVDLSRARAADPSFSDRWLGLVTAGLMRRFPFEESGIPLGPETEALVFAEVGSGAGAESVWLVRGAPPAGGSGARVFADGVFAVGHAPLLARLPEASESPPLGDLLSRLDPGATIAGASTGALRLPFHRYEGLELRPLPGEAFSVSLDFSHGDRELRFSGTVITAAPATEEEGRRFVGTLAAFLRPAGSLGRASGAIAAEATIGAAGREIRFDARIPRAALVAGATADGSGVGMTEPRGGHAAALLPDGGVLLAGGFDGSRGLSSLELFDPALGKAGEFTPSSIRLATRRVASAFAVSGDELFLFYGMTGLYEGLVNVDGEAVALRSGRGTRFEVPKGVGRLGGNAVTLEDGRILVAGGIVPSAGSEDAPDAWFFEPRSRRFSAVASRMSGRRGDAAAVRLRNGRVVFFGGVVDGAISDSIEQFDPATEEFRRLPLSLPEPITGGAAELLPNGNVLFAGGFDREGGRSVLLEIDVSGGTVTRAGRMSESRYYFPLVTLPDGRFLASGGGAGGFTMRSSFEILDPKTFRPPAPEPSRTEARR